MEQVGTFGTPQSAGHFSKTLVPFTKGKSSTGSFYDDDEFHEITPFRLGATHQDSPGLTETPSGRPAESCRPPDAPLFGPSRVPFDSTTRRPNLFRVHAGFRAFLLKQGVPEQTWFPKPIVFEGSGFLTI